MLKDKTAEMIESTKQAFISEFKRYITRPGADSLLAWLETTDFFTAPASTRFHLNRRGGLAQHSMNVYNRMSEVCSMESMYHDLECTQESIAVCALLHDICKANLYKPSARNRKSYDPEKVALAAPYNVKHDELGEFVWESVLGWTYEDPLPMGHGDKSLYLIMKHMTLTEDEAMAIRWHMGAWNDGEKQQASQAFEKCRLAVMLHVADTLATQIDEAGTAII